VRRDTAPSREARQDAASDAGPGFEVTGTLDARTNGGGFPGSDGATSGHVIPILEAGARTGKSTTDPRAGMGVGAEQDPMFTLQAGKQHAVAFAENSRAEVRLEGGDGSRTGAISTGGGKPGQGTPMVMTFDRQSSGEYGTADVASTVQARDYKNATDLVAQTVALRGCEGGGDKPHVLAFSAKDYGADAAKELAPTMRAGGHNKSHANAGVMPAIAFGLQTDVEAAVRRLTPRECERLQGFPDDYTLVPYRNKPAADGPRYKALGNSMAVPVMRWIGKRIDQQLNNN